MYVAMIFGQCSYLGPWQTHLVLDWSFVFQQVVRCYFYANEVWLLLSKRSAFVSVFFSKWGQSLYDIKFLPIWRHLIVSISTLFLTVSDNEIECYYLFWEKSLCFWKFLWVKKPQFFSSQNKLSVSKTFNFIIIDLKKRADIKTTSAFCDLKI